MPHFFGGYQKLVTFTKSLLQWRGFQQMLHSARGASSKQFSSNVVGRGAELLGFSSDLAGVPDSSFPAFSACSELERNLPVAQNSC